MQKGALHRSRAKANAVAKRHGPFNMAVYILLRVATYIFVSIKLFCNADAADDSEPYLTVFQPCSRRELSGQSNIENFVNRNNNSLKLRIANVLTAVCFASEEACLWTAQYLSLCGAYVVVVCAQS